jgi:predicted RNA binding protein YcfA (HicA-like mRNA interferase family)
MRRLPPKARYEEVEALLAMFGYTQTRSSGSHHVFWREGCDRLIVPKHHGQTVKRTYIRQILDHLEACGLIEPGE